MTEDLEKVSGGDRKDLFQEDALNRAKWRGRVLAIAERMG